ncbi:hypothetical protein QAD02_000617 [Eretmocerus hayati]|uniref:Uncharacterized protein n=1 Tax=Eretmocerus hayati TaxID=131215 RepID=A0ACC2NEK0_9HYME|nr:hypothetical protein QAD02_000617 [Eretmocerus hayati]
MLRGHHHIERIDVIYQKRLKKEKRTRKQTQDQLDLEIKRRTKLEDALRATGATLEQIRAITDTVSIEVSRTSGEASDESPPHPSSQSLRDPPPSSQSSSSSSGSSGHRILAKLPG